MQMKMHATNLFGNTGFILVLAFVIGLALPQGAAYTAKLITALLATSITLSVMDVPLQIFLDLKSTARPFGKMLLLNYVLLSMVIIGLAMLLFTDSDIRTGFILLAAVPPAITIIPFTYRLDGDVRFSLVGTVTANIAALALTPLISIAFLGTSVIHPGQLLIILAGLIAAPLGVAQLLKKTGAAARLEKHGGRGTAINWIFFVVTYTIVGLNQNAFLEQPMTLLRLAAIALVSTFVLGWITNRLFKSLNHSKADRISLMMMATMKNTALAATIAITLFSPRAALPAAMVTVFAISYFIWLSIRIKKMT